MADKSTKTEKAAEKAAAQEETKTYKVTARRNLGTSITGGARLDAGQEGEITLTPARHARLKKAGFFK